MNLNPLLIGVLLTLVISTLHGYRKGFIKIVITLISFVLTLWLVSVVTPYISTYLVEHTGLYDAVKGQVAEAFADNNALLDNTIPENQTTTINSYDVPSVMKSTLITNNTAETYTRLAVSAFEDYISSFLARIIINLAAFVCTFLMITIFLRMTFFSLEIISKIPIIKGINKFAGLFAGFAEGLIIVWIFFLAVTMFAGNTIGRQIFDLVQSDPLLNILYNSNVLLKIIYTFV